MSMRPAALRGGQEPNRLPPDGMFHVTVDRGTGRPLRAWVEIPDWRTDRFDLSVGFKSWNDAQFRLPEKLRSLVKGTF